MTDHKTADSPDTCVPKKLRYVSFASLPISGGIEPAHKRQAREKAKRDMGVGG